MRAHTLRGAHGSDTAPDGANISARAGPSSTPRSGIDRRPRHPGGVAVGSGSPTLPGFEVLMKGDAAFRGEMYTDLGMWGVHRSFAAGDRPPKLSWCSRCAGEVNRCRSPITTCHAQLTAPGWSVCRSICLAGRTADQAAQSSSGRSLCPSVRRPVDLAGRSVGQSQCRPKGR